MLLCAECHYAEFHYTECHYTCYAECQYTVCHYAECHYAECHYAKCRGGGTPLPPCKLLIVRTSYKDKDSSFLFTFSTKPEILIKKENTQI